MHRNYFLCEKVHEKIVSLTIICIFSFLGKAFAVFRDEEGIAHLLDAYCPHMGANLGAGGQVKGSCLECPFHGWRFDGNSGKCVSIPYLQGNTSK